LHQAIDMRSVYLLFILWLWVSVVSAGHTGSPSAIPAQRAGAVAMITWRGETEAEKGFMESLTTYRPGIFFRKYNANQDVAQLLVILERIRRQPVDLIYVFGTTATQTVLSEVKDLPVVFNAVNRPLEAGIIQSWARSGNNATGASNLVPVASQMQALQKVVKFQRLGIIYNPRESNSLIQRKIAATLQHSLGFVLEDFQITHASDLPVVMPLLKNRVDAVFIPADSLMISLGEALAHWINKLKLPSLAAMESMVRDHGLLLGLQPSYYQLGMLAAQKAHRILEGESPGQIPSSCLDYYQMTVNMQTARKIGVQIPISILVMANTIIR
jgi:putative ABC transport system substrate-binding protein